MTEDEAKTKWCPFARVAAGTNWEDKGIHADYGLAAHNRLGSHTDGAVAWPKGAKCIASACMAWRWFGTHVHDPENPKGDLIWSTRTHGTCGMAGPWYSEDRRPGDRP